MSSAITENETREDHRRLMKVAALTAEEQIVREACFDVFDSGWKCVPHCDIKHPWSFDPYDESEAETAQRIRFADQVVARARAIKKFDAAEMKEEEV